MSKILSYLLFADNKPPPLIQFSSCFLCPQFDLVFLTIYPSLNILCLSKLYTRLLLIYICIDCKEQVSSPLPQNADNIYTRKCNPF